MHLLRLESDTDPRVEGDDGAPWRVIEEVGYGCSASKEFFQEVLGQQRLGVMDEGELAKLVGAIARTRSSLNVSSCAEALRSLCAATGAGPVAGAGDETPVACEPGPNAESGNHTKKNLMTGKKTILLLHLN